MTNFFTSIKKQQSIFMMFLLVLATIYTPPSSSIAQIDATEAKAEWVYTLIPYIKYKSRATNPFNICVMGRETIDTHLNGIVAKAKEAAKSRGKSFTQTNVERKSAQSDFDDCHILYISFSEQKNLSSILNLTDDKPILTVSSIPRFSENGGIIELAEKGGGLVLRINEKSAQHAQITIDSDLLGFAERIY